MASNAIKYVSQGPLKTCLHTERGARSYIYTRGVYITKRWSSVRLPKVRSGENEPSGGGMLGS